MSVYDDVGGAMVKVEWSRMVWVRCFECDKERTVEKTHSYGRVYLFPEECECGGSWEEV